MRAAPSWNALGHSVRLASRAAGSPGAAGWPAEGVGFEPTRTRQRPSGFQDPLPKAPDLRLCRYPRKSGSVFGMI